jgi:hypothetical protein
MLKAIYILYANYFVQEQFLYSVGRTETAPTDDQNVIDKLNILGELNLIYSFTKTDVLRK